MDKIKVKLYDMILALSEAVDLVSPELSRHHRQVASLSFRMAEEMSYDLGGKRDILFAALLHDIGALSVNERLELIENEPISVRSHCFRGAMLIEHYLPFAHAADIIRHHHQPWENGKVKVFNGKEIPLGSYILHLADRICVKIDYGKDILIQIPPLLDQCRRQGGAAYMPEALEAVSRLEKKEYIWLELGLQNPLENIPEEVILGMPMIDIEEIIVVSGILSHVIDFRSRFTSTHSSGVAKAAEKLAELAGFSERECKMMLIAGYLHDLGKLSIDNAILEKSAKLNAKEYDIIRGHTYFTYKILDKIEGFETINKWASYHHEKLNGAGYPFHLSAEDIPLGARIMAVADVFTALTESRPYREEMGKPEVLRILRSMVDNGSLCREVAGILTDHYDEIWELCKNYQQQAFTYFDRYFSGTEYRIETA